MLSADTFERKVSDMKNKTKSILLGVLCAVCLQVPLNVGAVDLPIVPVEESQAETTTAASDVPAVTEACGARDTSDTRSSGDKQGSRNDKGIGK